MPSGSVNSAFRRAVEPDRTAALSQVLPFFLNLVIFLFAVISPVSAANALTHTTVTEHDAAGQKRFVTKHKANDPNGTTRRIVHDAAGQMTSFKEVRPRGELIASQSWRYDAGGRPEKRFRSPRATAFTPPSYTATYHPDNRMNTITPGGGTSVTVISDLDGNMKSVPLWEPTHAWAATVPSWDARNRLVGITTANATASYAYHYHYKVTDK